MSETGNAHDAGDCLDCQHPDHAYDGDIVSLDWLLRRFRLGDSEAYDREVEMARRDRMRPVEL